MASWAAGNSGSDGAQHYPPPSITPSTTALHPFVLLSSNVVARRAKSTSRKPYSHGGHLLRFPYAIMRGGPVGNRTRIVLVVDRSARLLAALPRRHKSIDVHAVDKDEWAWTMATRVLPCIARAASVTLCQTAGRHAPLGNYQAADSDMREQGVVLPAPLAPGRPPPPHPLTNQPHTHTTPTVTIPPRQANKQTPDATCARVEHRHALQVLSDKCCSRSSTVCVCNLHVAGLKTRAGWEESSEGAVGKTRALPNASQKQSNDTHKTPYDRVKRCRERKINTKASERVNSVRRRSVDRAVAERTLPRAERGWSPVPWIKDLRVGLSHRGMAPWAGVGGGAGDNVCLASQRAGPKSPFTSRVCRHTKGLDLQLAEENIHRRADCPWLAQPCLIEHAALQTCTMSTHCVLSGMRQKRDKKQSTADAAREVWEELEFFLEAIEMLAATVPQRGIIYLSARLCRGECYLGRGVGVEWVFTTSQLSARPCRSRRFSHSPLTPSLSGVCYFAAIISHLPQPQLL
ncbi:hypothetical protein PR048_028630 [Dryococelus australis]|uniref:Uncharacterized protein n=1 Tax=Dryococelus australis TaxID=614101 RepID=A0ABQ9GDS6_9NEOP|nr:hypothetical protein PR048_028630 [Dryococelus australis]